MANSDIDSWYIWKRKEEFQEVPRMNEPSNVGLLDSDSLQKSACKSAGSTSPRINGLVHRCADSARSGGGSEIRFINPAIYAESLDQEDEEHEVRIRVKINSNENGQASVGDSTDVTDLLSTLSIRNDLTARTVDRNCDQSSVQETYRCYSLASPVTVSSLDISTSRPKSVGSSRIGRVERRCKIGDKLAVYNRDGLYSDRQTEPDVQRYTLNGHRVVQISTTSFSSTSIVEQSVNGIQLARRIAHDEWMRKKQQAAQRKKEEEEETERQRQAEAMRLAREKEEKESRERECFLKWAERKKKEQEERKAIIEKELTLQKRLKEIEDKAATAKTLHLRQWARRKREEQKARERNLKLKENQIDEERKRRSEESLKAYEKWRAISKNKPKPATQGLLPHQKAKPSYVNPNPWQGTVDESLDEAQKITSNDKKTKMNVSKISSRKSVASQQ